MPKASVQNIQLLACRRFGQRGKHSSVLSSSGSADCCRPITNAPKPNIRFLKNIIKETDSHNAALRTKESQDARVRLGRLHNDISEPPFSRTRRRDEENLHVKRRRLDHQPDEVSLLRQRHRRSDSKRKSGCHQEGRKTRRNCHRVYESNEDDDENLRRRKHRHHHRSDHHRSRGRSEERDKRHSRRGSSRNKDQSCSPRVGREYCYHQIHIRERSASSERKPPDLGQSKRLLTQAESQSQGRTQNMPHKPLIPNESDSDPLESVIGPLPPPRSPGIQPRGRGTFASSCAMDNHFSSKYNPAEDVYPNSDSGDDWDQALEALRDRQRWKQQGADRLRLAGFTEEEVRKWEKGGDKRMEDVKWKGRGERREWDRGKVVGEEGIETRPEWGRG